jgi:hypothetical protein
VFNILLKLLWKTVNFGENVSELWILCQYQADVLERFYWQHAWQFLFHKKPAGALIHPGVDVIHLLPGDDIRLTSNILPRQFASGFWKLCQWDTKQFYTKIKYVPLAGASKMWGCSFRAPWSACLVSGRSKIWKLALVGSLFTSKWISLIWATTCGRT